MSSSLIVTVTAVVICMLLTLAISYIYDVIRENKSSKKLKFNLIQGLSIEEQAELKKKEQKLKKEHKKRRVPFQKIYEEYIFFGGSKTSFIKTIIFGYGITLVFYTVLSKSFLIGIIFSFLFFLIFYLLIERKNKKKRMNYLRSFSASLEILSSSIEAGNSLEGAISNVQKRENLSPRILKEFTTLNNNLKSSMSLDESLNRFWERNSMYEEFSMFVIVLQFFIKSGGRNLKEMFLSMKKSINQKIENYSAIDARIGSYKMMFTLFTVFEVAFTMLGWIFINDFYSNLTSSPVGILKAIGSVALTFLSTYLFNMMVRGAAEA